MAVLSSEDRVAIRAELARENSQTREDYGLTKTEQDAAIDAIDTWANSNAASLNAAIPLPARTTLTSKQKAKLFMQVVKRRWEVE